MAPHDLTELRLPAPEKGEFTPPDVEHEAAFLQEETGVEATIERLPDGGIRIVHENERLRLESYYRRRSAGWKRGASKLFQGGEPRPMVSSLPQYVALFKLMQSADAGQVVLPPLVPLLEGMKVPMEMQQFLDALHKDVDGRRDDVSFEVGTDAFGHHVVAVRSPRGVLHVRYLVRRRNGKRRAYSCSNCPVLLVGCDGRDYTAVVHADQGLALAWLYGDLQESG
ncbi:hypothetical protein ABZS76_32650 [Streptomyces sp. NPDC005562]|uniref:hypothetical protein n=1 Tax=Streptomyces sp. NPDC005562 TaxID=3154890 RepID=UPI0033ACE827